ncbi:hypothetical protein FACS1894219_10200 [Clostridia bacterium]|nr:hypothetical protein FACS1894219_10200 [Clostridia bacterium]
MQEYMEPLPQAPATNCKYILSNTGIDNQNGEEYDLYIDTKQKARFIEVLFDDVYFRRNAQIL